MQVCVNCNGKVKSEAKFCPYCGNRVSETSSQVEFVAPQSQDLTEPQKAEKREKKKRKGKKQKILFPLIGIILIACALLALFLQKTPKELYLLSEYNMYMQKSEQWEEQYGESVQFQKALLEQPSSTELTLTGNVEVEEDLMDTEIELMQEVLSQAAITLKTDQDPEKKESHHTLSLTMADEEALDVEVYQSNEKVGLKIPLLYEKFFYLNFNEFGAFMKTVDPSYEGPEELEFTQLELRELQLSEEEKEYLKKRYAQFFMTQLNEDNFNLTKNVKYEENGEKMKLREIALTLSPAETETLVNNLMNYIIEDDELHNLIAQRVAKVVKSTTFDEELNEDFNDPSVVKKEMVRGLKETKEAMEELEYPEGFRSVVLINNKEQIIERQITLAMSDGSSEVTYAEAIFKSIPHGDNQVAEELTVELTEGDIKAVFEMKNDISASETNRTEDVSISFYYEGSGEKGPEVNFTMVSDFQGKPNNQTIVRDFELESTSTDIPTALSGTITQEQDISLKNKYSNQKLDIELEVMDEYQYGSGVISASIDSQTKLTNQVKLPSLEEGSNEGINVADVTEEELYDIGSTVYENLIELGNKFGLIEEDYYYEDEEYYEEDYYYEDEEYYEEDYYEEDYY